MKPSTTISALAGTSRSLVSHFTSSTGRPRMAPIISYSHTPLGKGLPAQKGNTSCQPCTTATGIGRIASRCCEKCPPQCWVGISSLPILSGPSSWPR